MLVTFTAGGGLEIQVEKALEAGLVVGHQYELVGGTLLRYNSYYKLKGIKGAFNSCLFAEDLEETKSMLIWQL